ncbi:MAG TPA: winged helix-turn-helix transcriptional regulator [Gemmatimonadaceae bacterium]|nr:winged helix-turn-helix transcriptional regulator [Gemmatimonadaceae bacterium]
MICSHDSAAPQDDALARMDVGAEPALAVRLLAKRWTIAIVDALRHEDARFGELQRALPGVKHKVLTQHLRLLEAHGVVARVAATEDHVRYHLTSRGAALSPIIAALRQWDEGSAADAAAYPGAE